MASIIEGFLVRLGFDIDQDGMLKFNANIGNAAKKVAAVGKAAAATGLALGAAFAKSAHDVDRLYKISNNTGASIRGFTAISRAVANIGGNAENIQAAFVALTDNVKQYGASFERYLKEKLGVSLYDAQGRVRDMADVFVDLRNKLAELAKTNPGFAKQTADLIGLGGAFDDLMKKNFTGELERQQKAMAAWGDSLDSNASRANTLTTSLGRLWDSIATGAQTASLDFLEVSGLDTWVSNLAKQAETELPALAKTFKKGLQSAFDGSWWDSVKEGAEAVFIRRGVEAEVENPEVEELLSKYAANNKDKQTLVEQVIEVHQESRAESEAAYANPDSVPKWRPAEVENSTAAKIAPQISPVVKTEKKDSVEKRQPPIDLNVEIAKAEQEGDFERVIELIRLSKQGVENSETKPQSDTAPTNYQPEISVTPDIKVDADFSKVRGFRNFNPGNLREASGMTGKDRGGYAQFSSMEDGYRAMVKQVAMYRNAGLENIESIIRKWSPESENDTASYVSSVVQSMQKQLGESITARSRLDLNNSQVMDALIDAMINHENGAGAARYFDDVSYREALSEAMQTQQVSRVVSEKDRIPSNVTLNQNITVNGVQDGRKFAQDVVRTTNETVSRNVGANAF